MNILLPSRSSLKRIIKSAIYHMGTFWLFIASDIKTMIVLNVAFAYVFSCMDAQLSSAMFLKRLPRLLGWLAANLIPYISPSITSDEKRL